MLARKISELMMKQGGIEEERAALTERENALAARESEAEKAFAEITEETPQEERDAFDAEAAEIEKEHGEIDTAKQDIETRASGIETELAAAKQELDGINQRAAEAAQAAAEAAEKAESKTEDKREDKKMTAEKITRRERVADICTRSEVKEFLKNFRNTRAVGSPALGIPDVMLDLIIDDIAQQSKLMPYVDVQPVKGQGRAVIMAGTPEGVWTDTFGALAAVDLNLYSLSVLGGKISNYLAVPNPLLEDNDADLVEAIVSRIAAGQAQGLDRAIIYGTGTNMPVGILTRLAAVTSGSPAVPPSWWDANAPTFTDLHTSNIGKVSANNLTGLNLFKEMCEFLGKAKHQYAGAGKLFWAMNPKTALKLKIAAMEFNSNAALVSGVNATMPVIGGDIVEVSADVIPDNTIVGGYGDQYLLADRHDVTIRVSDQAKFLSDQTVYAGVARYDGKPKAGEGFVGFGLTTTAIATTTTFPTAASN